MKEDGKEQKKINRGKRQRKKEGGGLRYIDRLRKEKTKNWGTSVEFLEVVCIVEVNEDG